MYLPSQLKTAESDWKYSAIVKTILSSIFLKGKFKPASFWKAALQKQNLLKNA